MDNSELTPDPTDAVVADHCHLRIPSLPEWIEPTVDYLVRRSTLCGGLHSNRAMKVTLALVEGITNAIVHGNLAISSSLKEAGDRAYIDAITSRCADPEYAGRVVDVRSTFDGKDLRWVISDQGAGFDVDRALRQLDDPDPDPLRPSGRGLMLMRAFMDEMRYEDRGRRLVLSLRGKHGSECRFAPRLPFTTSVQVTPLDDAGQADWAASQPAMARNISAGGVSLLQSHLATQGRVLITIPTGGEPISLPAEVRHWHALSANVLEVGCRFAAGEADSTDAPPVHPGLSELVTRITESHRPLAERRGAVRVPYTECITVDLKDGAHLRGFARDLSRSGIAFFSTARVPLDAVSLTLPQGTASESLRLRAVVVRCTPLTEGYYDVAARFVG